MRDLPPGVVHDDESMPNSLRMPVATGARAIVEHTALSCVFAITILVGLVAASRMPHPEGIIFGVFAVFLCVPAIVYSLTRVVGRRSITVVGDVIRVTTRLGPFHRSRTIPFTQFAGVQVIRGRSEATIRLAQRSRDHRTLRPTPEMPGIRLLQMSPSTHEAAVQRIISDFVEARRP